MNAGKAANEPRLRGRLTQTGQQHCTVRRCFKNVFQQGDDALGSGYKSEAGTPSHLLPPFWQQATAHGLTLMSQVTARAPGTHKAAQPT